MVSPAPSPLRTFLRGSRPNPSPAWRVERLDDEAGLVWSLVAEAESEADAVAEVRQARPDDILRLARETRVAHYWVLRSEGQAVRLTAVAPRALPAVLSLGEDLARWIALRSFDWVAVWTEMDKGTRALRFAEFVGMGRQVLAGAALAVARRAVEAQRSVPGTSLGILQGLDVLDAWLVREASVQDVAGALLDCEAAEGNTSNRALLFASRAVQNALATALGDPGAAERAAFSGEASAGYATGQDAGPQHTWARGTEARAQAELVRTRIPLRALLLALADHGIIP